MNSSTFLAAQRAPKLVNRVKELGTIQRAIYEPEASCQIILIRGEGGMGKSRLSEEILWRGGNLQTREQRGPIPESQPEWDWTQYGKAIVGDLIDVSATQLHARAHFLRAIRDALIWNESGINFTKYDALFETFQDKRFFMGNHDYILELEQKAENQFLLDYKENAKGTRITIILDTVEKLYPIGGTELLLEEKLLTPEDMSFYTYQWLLKQIREDGFPNTTLILVGRGGEGKSFFDALEEAAAQNKNCRVTNLDIETFSLEDTKAYFQALAEKWKQESDTEVGEIASAITSIAADDGRIKTLWIYTNGQPVRLALYTDIIIEDRTIPEPLQESPEQAEKVKGTEELASAQKKIEAGFIHLLFGRPNLRAEILKALVRAPRRLGKEQLNYCLNSLPEESPKEWLERKETDRKQDEFEEQISGELKSLQGLAIVKIRPDNRLGLQDEVYRIYRNALAGDERGKDAEKKARAKLYKKLQDWAYYYFEERLEELTRFQAIDENKLRLDRSSQALEIRFPPLSKQEERERAQVHTEKQQWEVEYLHYALLLDFTKSINQVFFEMSDEKRLANDENSDALIQAEFWQVLKDPAYALEEFGNLTPWGGLTTSQQVLTAYERIALQSDVSGWIKRFAFRKKHIRAIEFALQVEKSIEKWGRNKKSDLRFWAPSWQHTLARSDRSLWINYSQIQISQDISNALMDMEKAVGDLEQLAYYPQDQIAIPDRNENGFKGHPAEEKLQRMIALYYNYIGYGHITIGHSAEAMNNYVKSLRTMRNVQLPHMESTARNNLSRVLSDRGYARGRRLCLDALNLRKKQGIENQIGLSYSTLALIDNNNTRPDLAWIEATIAVAYFRKANDPRGLGLGLLQLSKALRHMATQKTSLYHLGGDLPEIILETAERAVNEAVEIFTTDSAASSEITRRVEAWIEKGCLERDMADFTKEKKQTGRHYRDALYYLTQAGDLAREKNNIPLQLDTRVKTAWTHYKFKEFTRAAAMLKIAEELLPDGCWFTNASLPKADRDDIYVYRQLSKMYGLRGRMALEQFSNYVEEIKKKVLDKQMRRQKIHENETSQKFLKEAADAYVLSLAYSQLLSPRSGVLTTTYDWLYNQIKEFNLSELKDFYNYAMQSREKYRAKDIQVADYSDLNQFLEHTFGDLSEGL